MAERCPSLAWACGWTSALKSSRSLSVWAFAWDKLSMRNGSSGVFDRIEAAEFFSWKETGDFTFWVPRGVGRKRSFTSDKRSP